MVYTDANCTPHEINPNPNGALFRVAPETFKSSPCCLFSVHASAENVLNQRYDCFAYNLHAQDIDLRDATQRTMVMKKLWEHFNAAQQYFFTNAATLDPTGTAKFHYAIYPARNFIAKTQLKLRCLIGVVRGVSDDALHIHTFNGKMRSGQTLDVDDTRAVLNGPADFTSLAIRLDTTGAYGDALLYPESGEVCAVITTQNGDFICHYPIYNPQQFLLPPKSPYKCFDISLLKPYQAKDRAVTHEGQVLYENLLAFHEQQIDYMTYPHVDTLVVSGYADFFVENQEKRVYLQGRRVEDRAEAQRRHQRRQQRLQQQPPLTDQQQMEHWVGAERSAVQRALLNLPFIGTEKEQMATLFRMVRGLPHPSTVPQHWRDALANPKYTLPPNKKTYLFAAALKAQGIDFDSDCEDDCYNGDGWWSEDEDDY